MSYSPFIVPYDQLPETLLVFPLPGAIVQQVPGTWVGHPTLGAIRAS